MAATQTFWNGVPTKPDVDKLLVLFRKLEVGDEVSHESMEKVLHQQRSTARYRTVVTKARKEFAKESGVVLVAVSGSGLAYPSGRDQLRYGADKVRAGVRSVRRGTEITAMVGDDRLDSAGKAARDFAAQRMLALAEYTKTEARKIQMAVVPTKSLPS